jgi:hypothetical protein
MCWVRGKDYGAWVRHAKRELASLDGWKDWELLLLLIHNA